MSAGPLAGHRAVPPLIRAVCAVLLAIAHQGCIQAGPQPTWVLMTLAGSRLACRDM